ncbi:hypothetical protein, partial [uncultured Imperialibacter sp.]|uniref:hypothetical protein n=1 Tax=uncultured Imperialibacter sp. TaxID=1672639 RepID=UPI0030DB32E8
ASIDDASLRACPTPAADTDYRESANTPAAKGARPKQLKYLLMEGLRCCFPFRFVEIKEVTMCRDAESNLFILMVLLECRASLVRFR